MRLELHDTEVRIIPENPQDRVYLNTVLRAMEPKAVLVARTAVDVYGTVVVSEPSKVWYVAISAQEDGK